MANVPARVGERLSVGLKRFQPILSSAKTRDVNEADTVVIVVDMLGELFGYDKYTEVTREHAIKSTFCDLAIKIDGRVEFLIEVKAIDTDLRDAHVKQAVDYAANQGIEWVALTNGAVWRVYKVTFGKPIGQEVVLDIDLLALNAKNQASIDSLFLLSRESITKSGLVAYHDHKEATSRFFLAAIVLSDAVIETIRRELRRVSADAKVSADEIREALLQEVIKRDVVEGEKAQAAARKVQKSAGKMLRIRKGEVEEASAVVSQAVVAEAKVEEL